MVILILLTLLNHQIEVTTKCSAYTVYVASIILHFTLLLYIAYYMKAIQLFAHACTYVLKINYIKALCCAHVIFLFQEAIHHS